MKHLDAHQIIKEQQHGFRKKTRFLREPAYLNQRTGPFTGDQSQERADQFVLVESETSSETSSSAHLYNQVSGVSLLASIQEEQEILKDFLAAYVDSDDDFGNTGVCDNCNREPKEGT